MDFAYTVAKQKAETRRALLLLYHDASSLSRLFIFIFKFGFIVLAYTHKTGHKIIKYMCGWYYLSDRRLYGEDEKGCNQKVRD
jgi:hypothetical protein